MKNLQQSEQQMPEVGVHEVLNFFMISSVLFHFINLLFSGWILLMGRSLIDIVVLGVMLPSVSALAYTSLAIKTREKKQVNVVGCYIEGYKKCFKDTIKYGFIYAGILFYFFLTTGELGAHLNNLTHYAMFVLVVLASVLVSYMMTISTKYQFKLAGLFKVSIYVLLMHFKTTLKLAAVFTGIIFLMPMVHLMLIFIFMSPLIYLITSLSSSVLEEVYEVFVDKSTDPNYKETSDVISEESSTDIKTTEDE